MENNGCVDGKGLWKRRAMRKRDFTKGRKRKGVGKRGRTRVGEN